MATFQDSVLVFRDDLGIVLSPADARLVLTGQSDALFPLYSARCQCSVVPHFQEDFFQIPPGIFFEFLSRVQHTHTEDTQSYQANMSKVSM